MDQQLKKRIRNNAILIIIGVFLIIIFGNEKSWLRYFNILAILIILRSFIWFVSNSEELLFYFFPVVSFREKKPKFKDKIWSHISMVLFFSGLIFLIFQMNSIESLIDEKVFWKNFGSLGFGFSLISIYFLYKLQPSIFQESGRRYSVVFGFILGFMALTLSITSYLNKVKANPEIIRTEHTILRKSTGGSKNKSHWIFIQIRNSERRFKVSSSLWNSLKNGKKVLVKSQNGHFNYDFVTEIKPLIQISNQ